MISWREAPGLRFPLQVRILLTVQLSNWRWSWRQIILTGMMAPLVTVAGLGLNASGREARVYALSGAVCMALLFELQNRVAGNYAFMKSNGALDFFAALPVRRESLVLATLFAFCLLALPAVLVTIVAGSWIVGLPLVVTWWALPVLVCCLAAPAFIGSWLGARSSSMEEASSLSLALTIGMLVCGPVAVPPDRLPDFLVTAGYVNPAVHTAAVIRAVLFGEMLAPGVLVAHLAFLTLFAAACWWITRTSMEWRARRVS